MSNQLGLTVIRPGVQSSLQDLGRFGHAKLGLSQGGALDFHAHCWANKLLENPVSCPTLEVVVGMAEFRAECDLSLALAGADMEASVNGSFVGNWCVFNMTQGDTLELKPARNGMRTYLAVFGGFSAELTLGSVSTVVRNQLGGLDGGLLKVNDFIPAGSSQLEKTILTPHRFIPDYPDQIDLRVIESYQNSQFADEEKKTFYQSEYVVTQDSDRMGVRLTGPPIKFPTDGMISEGIALGSIQIPANGQPIILLNDRQTLGGYPKLGCVAKVDLPKLAQARPGTRVKVSPISSAQARTEWCEFSRFFKMP